MNKPYITTSSRRDYQAKAHVERSLAFQASLKTIGYSVKYLFSQPERILLSTENKKRRVSNLKPDAEIVNCGAV